jgi:hypothetical protein
VLFSWMWLRVYSGRNSPTFRSNVLPLSAGSIIHKASSKLPACLAYLRNWRWRQYVPPKRRWTYPKTRRFILKDLFWNLCIPLMSMSFHTFCDARCAMQMLVLVYLWCNPHHLASRKATDCSGNAVYANVLRGHTFLANWISSRLHTTLRPLS